MRNTTSTPTNDPKATALAAYEKAKAEAKALRDKLAQAKAAAEAAGAFTGDVAAIGRDAETGNWQVDFAPTDKRTQDGRPYLFSANNVRVMIDGKAYTLNAYCVEAKA